MGLVDGRLVVGNLDGIIEGVTVGSSVNGCGVVVVMGGARS